jgi:hypothetical protein
MSGSVHSQRPTRFVRAFSDDLKDAEGNFFKRPSIRHIQRNIVKDRAVCFENKDLRSREVQSNKSAMASNFPHSGNLRPAKSLGNLKSAGLSDDPGARCTGNKADCLMPLKIDVRLEVSEDIVAKRRSMFESLASPKVTAAKPALSPKPSLPACFERGVQLSKLTPSKGSVLLPTPAEQEVSCASPNASEISGRQVHLSPSETASLSRQRASSPFDRSRLANSVNCPEPGRTAPAAVDATSAARNRKTLSPAPPPKPPRTFASQLVAPAADSSYGILVYAATCTKSIDSAANAAVCVERIERKEASASPTLQRSCVTDSPFNNKSLSPGTMSSLSSASAVCSGSSSSRGSSPKVREKFNDKAQPSSSSDAVPNRVPLRSAVGNTSATLPTNGRQLNDLWEKKFIRSPAAVTATHAKGKDRFMKKKCINNPSYMYVGATDDATLQPRATVNDLAVRSMLRHSSNDALNVPPSDYFEEPAYAEPYALIRPLWNADRGVQFDSSGYALPSEVSENGCRWKQSKPKKFQAFEHL